MYPCQRWRGVLNTKQRVLALVSGAGAQYHFSQFKCPPENVGVAAFRQFTDVREPLPIPNIDRIMTDLEYADPEIQDSLKDVDIVAKVALPLNDTNSFKVFAPIVDRCCEELGYPCRSDEIILQYVKFQGGACWVVWPDAYYVYKKCTCCSCLLKEDCPVVGRCVEVDYHTVEVIAYCEHIMYSDRYQKIALQIPTICRCRAKCPATLDYILPGNTPELSKNTKQNTGVEMAVAHG